VLDLAKGERLGINFTGTLTSMAGLLVTITYSPGNKGEIAVYNMNANGDLIDQSFFIANRPLKIAAIYEAHSTKSSGATNVQVEKCTGTTAAGSGTVLLTNDSNAGFETDAVANTYQTGALSATASELRLAMTDRLAVDFNGTLTALAGVVIVVLFEPTYDRKEINFNLQKNANQVDQAIFIADRDYEILAAYCSWGTAATGTSNIQLTLDVTADAPGAGTNLLTNDTNAGFQDDGTANTPELATWYTTMGTPRPLVLAGDRLSLDYASTTNLAGTIVTISLKPV